MDNPFAKAADAVMNFINKNPVVATEKARDDVAGPTAEPFKELYLAESQVDKTLAERGSRYGTFIDNSEVYDNLMEIFQSSPNWDSAPPHVHHALGNIATKLARLLTGDILYFDNWRDIAGYATLMDKICQGEIR